MRSRALAGEALSLWLRMAGDAAPAFVPFVVRSCLVVLRSLDRPSLSASVYTGADVTAGDAYSRLSVDIRTLRIVEASESLWLSFIPFTRGNVFSSNYYSRLGK